MPSWRAALVYKPVTIGSIYFDAGTSFNPSAESLSLSAATANLPPEKNRTYELGHQVGPRPSAPLPARARIFRNRENQCARARSRQSSAGRSGRDTSAWTACEFQAQGPHHQPLGDCCRASPISIARWSARSIIPAAVGYPLANVPKYTFNFWTEYRLPQTLGGRRGQQLCFQPHRQLDRAARSHHRACSRKCRATGCSTRW